MAPRAPVPHLTHPALLPEPKSRARRLLESIVAALFVPVTVFGALVAFLASRAHMPGVVVETYTRPGPSDLGVAEGADFFVVGLTERGTTTGVVTVGSMTEYTDKLGDRVSYGSVWDAINTYFAEGGTEAHVARIVGAAATLGTLTLNDRAGTPLATLRIDAVDAGAWSSRMKVKVDDGSVTNTFKITVLYDDQVAEVYNNLATPAAAATALAASRYVRGANLASATAAPSNNPAVLAATVLSTGTDDRGTLNAASHTGALSRFGAELGPGAVAIPGFDSSQVGTLLVAHARTTSRLALLAGTSTATPAQAKAAALEFIATTGAEYAGLFYPWVKVPDGAGSTRTISPEGYVAGVRARAHVQAGPWRVPAGELATARHITGLARELTTDEANDLNNERVSAIRTILSTTRLYGWRSLSADSVNFRLLTGRDVMNEVAWLGQRRLERFVFGAVDSRGQFQAQIAAEMIAVLEPMRKAGGLYKKTAANGDFIDVGYVVDAGPAVNTPDRLAMDEVAVEVALRVAPAAELIRLRIAKVAFGTNL